MVTNGYRKAAYERLEFYKNIRILRKKIYDLTEKFSKNYIRLSGQMRDAARSSKQNIIEGYAKDTAGEFARSIKISKGSLCELEGDLDDCREDDLIREKDYTVLKETISKAKYQIDRYLDSLYKLEKEGKWKSRFKRNRW